MQTLLPLAKEVGNLLKTRKEKIAVAESAAGGLINAALLAAPPQIFDSAGLTPRRGYRRAVA